MICRSGRFLCILALLFTWAEALPAMSDASPPAAVVDSRFYTTDLVPFLEVLKDTGRALTIETICLPENSSRFQPGNNRSSFGYSLSAYWFRFKVINPESTPVSFLVEHSYPVVDHIDFFIPESDGWHVYHSGDGIPFSSRPIPYRTTVIPATLQPGPHTIYFRIQTLGTIAVPLTAWNPGAFERHREITSALHWLSYGAMFTAAVYCLFLFVSTRARVYLFLTIVIVGSSIFSMVHSGIAFQYLWPMSIQWASIAHPVSGYTGLFGALLFTRSFLSTAVTLPRFNTVLLILGSAVPVLAALSFVIPYGTATRCMAVYSGICAFAMIACGLVMTARGQRQARFYVIAWTALLLSTMALFLKSFGIMDSSVMADSGIQISLAILVFLLSFGIIDKLFMIQKEKQAALRAVETSGRQYQLLADNVKDVIWTLDLATLKLNYITPSVEAMLGFTPDEARLFSFREMLPEQSRQIAWNEIKQRLSTDESRAPDKGQDNTIVLQCYNRNKDLIWTETTTSFLRDSNAVPVELIGVTRDITERTRVEKEKQALEAQLIQSNKLEAIGTLAGGIAHDMNNILTAILGYVEISSSEVPPESRIHYRLKRVVQACNRARDLVRQILTFSRQGSQEQKPVRINLIIKEVLKLIRATVPTTIKLRQSIPHESFIVLADPTQIHQIIMNLCSNASHAMQSAGGSLTVSLERMILDPDSAGRYIDLSAGPYIRLSVSDTGSGMDAETMNRAFEPFFTTKPKGQGTGMGLAMVHGIVSKLKGKVHIYSEPGAGTTVSILLPEAPEAVTPDVQPDGFSHLFGEETILYVDDEHDIVDMAAEMLSSLGYTVITATESPEALTIFTDNPQQFDLVITDHTMPDMTGTELAGKLKRIRQDIPVLLCTGFSRNVDPESMAQQGISAFIMKPFSKKDLVRTIRNVLDASRPVRS